MQNEVEFLVDCFVAYLKTLYHVKIMLNVMTCELERERRKRLSFLSRYHQSSID
jgi:hypothetical protein